MTHTTGELLIAGSAVIYVDISLPRSCPVDPSDLVFGVIMFTGAVRAELTAHYRDWQALVASLHEQVAGAR